MTVTLDKAYCLAEQVALRPEPFGALAYNYDNRRLVFLRSPDIVRVVESLEESVDLAAVFTNVGIALERQPAFLAALGDLENAGVIHAC